jgi:hypothetical protein
LIAYHRIVEVRPLVALVAAGCYSPGVASECTVTCADTACPDAANGGGGGYIIIYSQQPAGIAPTVMTSPPISMRARTTSRS